jgi:hypothetical protein
MFIRSEFWNTASVRRRTVLSSTGMGCGYILESRRSRITLRKQRIHLEIRAANTLQSVRFGFAVRSQGKGEGQAIVWLRVVRGKLVSQLWFSEKCALGWPVYNSAPPYAIFLHRADGCYLLRLSAPLMVRSKLPIPLSMSMTVRFGGYLG